MNRIDQKFEELKKRKKKAFIAFLTAGDPSLAITEKLVIGFGQAGVDIVEIGIPFSDPLADGPTIQESSQRALNRHITVDKIFSTVSRIRKKSQMPIVLMTYYNPVFHFGEERFIKKAKKAGADGLIIPDLPPEEAKTLINCAQKNGMATTFFLSPTTRKSRTRTITKASTGFVYYVSLTGVTGARKNLPKTIAADVRQAKKYTNKPVCVGFGVSTSAQVRSISRIADGVIVGSAIVKEIEKHIGRSYLTKKVCRFVAKLSKSI